MAQTTLSSYKLWRARTLAGALFFIAAALSANAKPLEGNVIVVDGDTLEVGGQRVRLEGIDAPELAQTCKNARGEIWNCGSAAAEVLGALIEGKSVACDSVGQDKYGRTLGLCFADSDEINAAMVRTGYAWAFVKYSTAYTAQEGQAKAVSAGVWQGQAIPPWEFRHAGTGAAQVAPAGCNIKGNISKAGQIYHLPTNAWYAKVKVDLDRGERWFCSEAEARAAGWRPVIDQRISETNR